MGEDDTFNALKKLPVSDVMDKISTLASETFHKKILTTTEFYNQRNNIITNAGWSFNEYYDYIQKHHICEL